MGRYVEIKKIRSSSDSYCYSVYSSDYPQAEKFYIEIDPHEKSIIFYHDSAFQYPELTFFLDRPDEDLIKTSTLPDFLIYTSIRKAKQAIESDSFDDYISFQS